MANTRIQFSTATEERWNAANPVLLEGEIAYVRKSTGKYKTVIGGQGGSKYNESVPVWDQEQAEQIITDAQKAMNSANSAITIANQAKDGAAASAATATEAMNEANTAKNTAVDAASTAATETASQITTAMQGYLTSAEAAKSAADSVGKYKSAGLPNVTGKANISFSNVQISIANQSNGVLGYSMEPESMAAVSVAGYIPTPAGYGAMLALDLNKGNPIYGNSTTVQPPAGGLIPQI